MRSIEISVLGGFDYKLGDSNDLNTDVLTKGQMIIYTIIFVYINFTSGLTSASFPPAYVDFSHLLNTSLVRIDLFSTFQYLGAVAGAFVPLLFKRIKRQLTLVTLITGMALTTLFIPYSTEFWQLYICGFVYGLGVGACSGTNCVLLIEIWQHKSPSILQLAKFMNCFGGILGPLIVNNYIIGNMICPGVWPQECDGYNQTITNSTLESTPECTIECLHYDRRPRLKIPFLIVGLLTLIGPTALLVMYFVKRYYYNNNWKTEVWNEELEARHKQYVPKKTILIGISIFFVFSIMSQYLYSEYNSTFFQYLSPLYLSASMASEISSTISVAMCVGSFICIFVVMYIKPQFIISIQLFLVFFGLLFQIFGQDQLDLLWTSAAIIGLGYSSQMDCLFSFVNQYMEVTDRMGGLFIGAYNVLLGTLMPYLLGQLIPTHPSYFLYIEITCVSLGIIAFSIVCISVRNVPKDLIRKIWTYGSNAGHKGSVGD